MISKYLALFENLKRDASRIDINPEALEAKMQMSPKDRREMKESDFKIFAIALGIFVIMTLIGINVWLINA